MTCGCRVRFDWAGGLEGAETAKSIPDARIVYCPTHTPVAERGTMKPCGCHCAPDLTDGGCVWEVEWCALHGATERLAAALRAYLRLWERDMPYPFFEAQDAEARALLREIGR